MSDISVIYGDLAKRNSIRGILDIVKTTFREYRHFVYNKIDLRESNIMNYSPHNKDRIRSQKYKGQKIFCRKIRQLKFKILYSWTKMYVIRFLRF